MCLSRAKEIQSAFIILLIHPLRRPQQPRGFFLLHDAVIATNLAGLSHHARKEGSPLPHTSSTRLWAAYRCCTQRWWWHARWKGPRMTCPKTQLGCRAVKPWAAVEAASWNILRVVIHQKWGFSRTKRSCKFMFQSSGCVWKCQHSPARCFQGKNV